MVPVLSLGLTISSGRVLSFPRTEITKFPRKEWASWWARWSIWGLSTTCVRPYLSHRSTKISPPWSLRVCTHPQRVTISSRFFSFNSPQVCVRCIMYSYKRARKPSKDQPTYWKCGIFARDNTAEVEIVAQVFRITQCTPKKADLVRKIYGKFTDQR